MLISSEADIAAHTAALATLCPHMAMIAETLGPPPLRWREPGFSGLISTITAQQLSVSSANAIRTKLHAAIDPLTPEALHAASDETLRACGLSGPKIKTLRALAEAITSGALPFDRLGDFPPDEAQAMMVKIHGIGPWTAEVYMMFCLGVADIFAPADLALQEGAKLAMGLEARPTTKDMAKIAERWKPHRATAARLLWAYYGHVKKRQGVVSA
jgi:DNA-3-methyladenine glycosylase II